MGYRFRVLLAATVIAAASAAQQTSQVPWWAGTWEGAFVEAKVRNVPVLVVFIQDGEEANERVATGTFKDPEYVKLAHKTVPVLANREFHGIKKDETGGHVRAVCAKFGAVSCEVHQNLETPARTELCGSDVQTPQHVYVLPDKTVVTRVVDVVPVSGHQEILAKATKTLGRGLTAVELKQARDHLREAAVRVEKQEWAAALKAVRDAAAIARGTPFSKNVDAYATRIDDAARKILAAALASESKGDVFEAVRALDDAVTVFAGTDPAAALKKELARIKGTKPGAEAARVLAKDKNARPNYDAGLAAERAKDFVVARREYQRVLTSAPGTPVADAAKARIAVLEADPDIKALFDRVDRDAKAAALLKDAEKLAAAGSKDAARDVLKRVMAEFGGTPAANTAKTRLEELR